MVAAIRQKLGPYGRLDCLRIVDSFGAPGPLHPLSQTQDLLPLKGLFAPGGRVEVFAGAPSSAPGPAGATGMLGMSGMMGMSGATMGGAVQRPVLQQRLNVTALSTLLGVPVTLG